MSKFFLDIIFENNDLVAINKPSGLLSIPSANGNEEQDSLKHLLKQKYGSIFTVHRLDRQTSGAIIYAKNEQTHKLLSEEFESRKVTKIYIGIVKGTLSQKKGSVDFPIAPHPTKRNLMVASATGKPSKTDYEVLEEFKTFSLLQFQIHTGRTHQIRVHAQYLGHPIVCDNLYGNGEPVFISSFKKRFKLSKSAEGEKPILSRLALHSSLINFKEADGNEISINAPLAQDMKALFQQLRKWDRC